MRSYLFVFYFLCIDSVCQQVKPADFSTIPNSPCAIKVAKYINDANNIRNCQDAINVGNLIIQAVNEGCSQTIGMANQSHLLYINKATAKLKAFLNANNCEGNGSATTNSNASSNNSGQNFATPKINTSDQFSQILNQINTVNLQKEIDRQNVVSEVVTSNKYSNTENIDQSKIDSDVIILKNGSILKVFIIEVNDELITYKKAILPEGPTFTIKKSNIREYRTLEKK